MIDGPKSDDRRGDDDHREERGRVTLLPRLSMGIDLVLTDGWYRDLDDFVFSAVRAELDRALDRKRVELEREGRA